MDSEENNTYDFKTIEGKWASQWSEDKIYETQIDESKEKFYCLDTWPYPSAEGVHIGYVKSFGGMDVTARYKRMKGFNVLYPMGWDTFGLPAENFALKLNKHPKEITDESIKMFKKQFNAFGLSYDWTRELNTADPSYYKWTQWVFLVMFKKGLAYRKMSSVNWCPNDKTVVANEQVIDGKCERCGADIEKKELMQWFFKVTDYADRLYEDCSKLDWDEKYLNVHKSWIGKEVKDGETRFHVRDWSIARQRYWGPPIPIIYCEKCGTVPVPEDQLPVMLPYDVNLTPTGESPLASREDFVNTVCPTCGGHAKREVDILDTFVSSSWYELRFPDPSNNDEAISKKALAYWKNVDHYEGTIEHLTAHLVYARFVTKVLFDAGYVPFDEPFPKFTPVGLLVDRTGTKFSKRLGNAPDTNELIQEYGGDLLRLSCFFITPFDDISRWGVQDIVGVQKFTNRTWRVFKEKVDGKNYEMPEAVIKHLNQLIKDVEGGIEKMRYNVAISKMMVFVSEMIGYEGMIDAKVWGTFIKLLAPFAPFMAEEVWNQLGNSDSVHTTLWPEYDRKYTDQEIVIITIQVDGKAKGSIEVSTGSDQDAVIAKIKEDEKLSKHIRENVEIFFIKDKVMNFVTKS